MNKCSRGVHCLMTGAVRGITRALQTKFSSFFHNIPFIDGIINIFSDNIFNVTLDSTILYVFQ